MKFVLGAIKDTQLRKTITFGYLLMEPVLTIKTTTTMSQAHYGV